MGEWTIFSNHGHVLVCLAYNNQARLRDVAAEVGITERAVQNILRELQGSGLVQVTKHGRCNHYQINTRKSLRHPLESHCTVGKLLQLLRPDSGEAKAQPPSAPEKPAEKKTASSKPGTARSKAPAVPKAEEKVAAKTEDIAAPDSKPPPKTQPKPAPEKAVPAATADSKAAAEEPADQKATSEDSEASGDKPKAKKSDKPDTQQGSLF